MLPYSVAHVKERIISRFPRMSAKFSDAIEDNIEDWIRTLADTYPYWFLTVYPGHRLHTTFPYANNAALAAISPRAGNWVDAGWLVTSPGTAVYDVYHPLESSDAAIPGNWEPCKMQMVDYVYEFNLSGQPVGSLSIPEFEAGLINANFKNTAKPCQVMWQNLEDRAQITFHPTPDKAYLYCIQYVIKDPPMYQEDGVDEEGNAIIRNRFLTAEPEAVILYGLLQAARFFNEGAMKEDIAKDLYGNVPTDYGIGSEIRGGILGRAKKATLRRNKHARMQMQQYSSMSEATGRIPNAINNKSLIWGNRGRRYY